MNAHTSQEKRTIKVKDFLDDFRSGLPETEILKKFNLTLAGLEKFFTMLLERNIVDEAELQEYYQREQTAGEKAAQPESDQSTYMCPCCLAAQDTMFDICPSCGVSFQELVSGEKPAAEPEAVKPAQQTLETKAVEAESAADTVQVGSPLAAEQAPKKVGPMVDDDFVAEDLRTHNRGFDDALDEIVPGMPLDCIDEPEKTVAPKCEQCQEDMKAGIRDIYDQRRSKLALSAAGLLFVLGFFGVAGLGFLDGFSFSRLVVLYATGMFLIFGTALSFVGLFTFMARERVHFCASCGRVTPRG